MKKILLCYALCVSVVAGWGFWRHREAERLENNVVALAEKVSFYRTQCDESAASVQALQLRCDEFRKLRADDARRIRNLEIKLKRVESTSIAAVKTQIATTAPLRDTTIMCEKLQTFVWGDPWVSVEGVVLGDSVECCIRSVDTLRQVVHRVPRRFLFIKYGTKAIRQEIISSNPHTRVVYSEYIELKKNRKVKKSR